MPHGVGPLAGVRVVAVEQAVAAPLCSRRLAEAGAEVIKIERPEGDFARYYDSAVAGESAYFVWLNYAKRSVVLDLSSAEGRSQLLALIASADVLLQNLKPGALARLGIDLDALHAEHPRLISCSIAGYSASGPSARKKAYDLLIQAETGLASITGSPQEAGRVGVSVCDIACGMFAYDNILLALLARATSGTGCALEVTLFDALAQWMAVPYLLERYGGSAPQRVGLNHPGIAPYGVFTAADGQAFVLAIQNEREWAALCRKFLDRPEWVSDARTCTNEARLAHRDLVDGAVGARAASLAFAAVTRALTAADVAHAPVNAVSALREHADFRTQVVQVNGTSIAVPVTPGAVVPAVPHSVPVLGADTAAVLAELALQ